MHDKQNPSILLNSFPKLSRKTNFGKIFILYFKYVNKAGVFLNNQFEEVLKHDFIESDFTAAGI